jgi:hypothetical protein
MGEIITFYKVEEALTRPGCPICRLREAAVASFLDDLIYERVNDPGTRDDVMRSMGFCNRHARQLVEHGGALGIAIIHRDLVRRALKEIGRGRFRKNRARVFPSASPSPMRGLVEALSPRAECPACRQGETVEGIYLQALVSHLEEVRELMREDNALCLPHFRKALEFVQDEKAFQLLAEWEGAALGHMDAELSEFIRKNDYRFADEETGAEGDSWQRAAALVSGDLSTGW